MTLLRTLSFAFAAIIACTNLAIAKKYPEPVQYIINGTGTYEVFKERVRQRSITFPNYCLAEVHLLLTQPEGYVGFHDITPVPLKKVDAERIKINEKLRFC